jgi:O-antigen ligase
MRDFIVEGCLYLTFFFTVFFFGSVAYPAFLLLSGFCYFLFLLQFNRFDDFEKISKFSLLSLLFLMIWIMIQTVFFSEDITQSLYQVMKWLGMVAVFFVIQKLKYKQVLRIIFAVILMSFFFSIYALYEVLSGHEHVLWEAKSDHLSYLTGTFRNRNHFAGFLQLALGATFGALMRDLSKKKYVNFFLQLLLCFFLFVILIRTGSRSGLVCFVGALFFLGVTTLKKNIYMGFSFIVFSICGIAFGLYMGYDIFSLRVFALAEDLPSLEGRLSAWKSVVTMTDFYFWKGVGLGNFGAFFPNFQSADIVYGWQHAHQDYLELIIEIGAPGLVLLILTVASIFFSCVFNVFTKKQGSMYLVLGLLTGCFSLMLHAFMDFNFAVPANAYLFIVFLAASYRLCKFEKKVYVVKKKKAIEGDS